MNNPAVSPQRAQDIARLKTFLISQLQHELEGKSIPNEERRAII